MSELLSSLRSPLPRPDGPFRLLGTAEAAAAFEAARLVNRDLRSRHEELLGFELVEVHPVILGGDPEDIANKRAVDRATHEQLMAFWDRESPARGELPPGEAAPDLAIYADVDEWVILPGPSADVILRPLKAVSSISGLAMFGSDGAGTAYVWGVGSDGPGVYEMPAVPPDPRLARRLGRTVSDLLDAACSSPE